jgi:RimJ/RimL family protein N-acetyltransferase
MLYRELFEGQAIRLTPIDFEKDMSIVAEWTDQPEIARRMNFSQPTRPMSELQVKKVFEGWLKEAEQPNRAYVFAIRQKPVDRLIGYLRIAEILWVHGAAHFELVLGDPEDREEYSREALHLGLGYAFEELNLFRVTAVVEEHEATNTALYTRSKFYLEVRQRQAVFFDGRYWDRLNFGMLRPEWAAYQQELGVAQ